MAILKIPTFLVGCVSWDRVLVSENMSMKNMDEKTN
jgi:hypothetical protein